MGFKCDACLGLAPKRCWATAISGVQCIGDAGHTGPHSTGSGSWFGADLVERSCTSAEHKSELRAVIRDWWNDTLRGTWAQILQDPDQRDTALEELAVRIEKSE